ncbi:gamma-butyrobetaine dioxygenase-like isoform X2 [Corticium candelabrum]|uniref:gamma-butyrobetaine dioxygenase-like isoform X2 n=1 Tax=Corticium candelabrum TaxID=121492 RepID=UPI002E31C835|nr:gamma-butyrobetaine dioxygenase-like isoform X2 [Corticium candelabrum]
MLCRIYQLRKALHLHLPASKRLLSLANEFISSVHLENTGLSVHWTSNRTAHLPYIFLRDNCQEPESFDPTAKQRLFNPVFSVDLDIKAKSANVSDDGGEVTITWPDGHISRYSSVWLTEHSEGADFDTARLPVEQKLWKSDIVDKMATFDFEQVINDDGSLLKVLLQLDSYGIVMMENVGLTSNQVKRFCDRISFPKTTVYGQDVMKVETTSNPYNLAYSNVAIHLHTDLPYYNYCPGVLMLHCTEQLSGNRGSTYFCDGFNVAYELRERNLAAFEMLSQYPVFFATVGKYYLPYKMEWWRIPITVNLSGRITDIHFSNFVRGSRYHSSLNGRLQECQIQVAARANGGA